jgi:hypothetical protein
LNKRRMNKKFKKQMFGIKKVHGDDLKSVSWAEMTPDQVLKAMNEVLEYHRQSCQRKNCRF